MRLFSNNIVPYTSTEGDKIYPIVVDIKKGIKSGEAISFVTADNQVGVITVDFMDGNSSYNIEGCMVTSTIHRPDGTVLEIPCDIVSQSTIEIPLGINGTYQEGTHTFDLKIVRGNGKVIGVPTMSYSVSGSLSSDGVVEGDDRLPVLTMVLDNAQDKLTRLDRAIAGATNDLEVKEARDGEVTLNARLERDLAKGKIHFADIEGSSISTESEEGYLENVEIHGNTWQDANNLSDIRSVGTKVEGQELYKIDVVSCGKNLFNKVFKDALNNINGVTVNDSGVVTINGTLSTHAMFNVVIPKGEYRTTTFSDSIMALHVFWQGRDSGFQFNRTLSYTEDTTLQCYISSGTYDNYICKFQLEEGTQATSYEPYKEDKLTILSPTPLEKVGDVADRIICKDGVWGVEKNIEEVIINETYVPNLFKLSDDGTKFRVNFDFDAYNMTSNLKATPDIICDKFLPVNRDSLYVLDKVGISQYITGRFFICNYSNVLDTKNITGVKNWLKLNPILVKYQATRPTFIPLPHDQQVKLRTFADKTHISFDTEIEGTIKAQVPKSLGATVNTHTTQIDNLNRELDRVKKLEESTVSTVTSNKAFTTVAETTSGYFEDVRVEGKTLVNLVQSSSFYVQQQGSNTVQNEYRVVTGISTGNDSTSLIYRLVLTELKADTVYTILVPYSTKCNYIVRDATNKVNLSNHIGHISNIFTFKTLSSTSLIDFYYHKLVLDDKVLENNQFLIIEGDHTDKDITFFEGLKSVGQDTDISISSVNENLLMPFHTGSPVGFSNLNAISFSSDHSISYKATAWGQGVKVHVSGVSKGEKYLLLFDSNLNGVMRGYGGLETGRDISCHDNKIEITAVSSGDAHIVFKNTSEVCDVSYTNARLVREASIDTNYKLHKQDKKQLLYYNPTTQTWEKPVLREWDSIEKHDDGKYYYHKRSEEVVLNGSESWELYSPLNQNNTKGFTLGLNNIMPQMDTAEIGKIVVDKFKVVAQINLWSDDIESASVSNTPYLRFRILESKLSTQNVAGFKQWLQANNVTVVYQLAQEEVYECTNLDLITYGGETNLIVNSGAIQPKITLKVLSNVSNVVKLLQEKVSILENKFIKGLQQVLAGDMMSLAHLLYPEDFENNHEIQTLEL